VIAVFLVVAALQGAAAAPSPRELVAATDAALARGDYAAALRQAQQAFDAHERLGQHADAAWDLNAIGLANQYLGRYDAALDGYRRALALDRAAGSGDGEVMRLNNIGNVHFLQGRYSDALALYEEALQAVDTKASQRRERLRMMTLSNMAVLDQRIGADERALDLYRRLAAGETLQAADQAQSLVNRGALFRRLGDPVKALELYRQAQQLFARAEHRDGQIGAWRNIGIAYALDLHDNAHAFEAFDAALMLARTSSNRRGTVQALLYRGESLRRIGRAETADADLTEALGTAMAAGLVEEQWKALYSLGLLHHSRAELERAVATIESVRADIRTVTLRSEFLADKRDVYDALIALRLTEQPVNIADLFQLLERSRARTWQDRLAANAAPPTLAAMQAALPANTRLLEYWSGSDTIARLSITREAATLTALPLSADDQRAIEQFGEAIRRRDPDWRTLSKRVGALVMPADDAGAGRTESDLLIVPDGSLQFLPFDAVTIPRSADELLVERFAVTYLPSAAFLTRKRADAEGRPGSSAGWRWPWQREVVAFGDPAPARAYPLEPRPLPPLPYAADEARRIARELPGAATVHIGADARKALFVDRQAQAAPVVHFATHAVADTRDPERSRILLAPSSADASADYLFLREIYDVDLSRVSLVTLSACDTERGKVIRGEGVEGFSRAILAAGAASAVTTQWSVADRAGAEFMAQFYYALGSRHSKAAALREAKLRFLRTGHAWSHPYYWSAYVLNGDGAQPLPRVVPWLAIVMTALLVVFAVTAVAAIARGRSRSTPSPHRPADETHQSAAMK
jgi:CHAT domain-containing protein